MASASFSRVTDTYVRYFISSADADYYYTCQYKTSSGSWTSISGATALIGSTSYTKDCYVGSSGVYCRVMQQTSSGAVSYIPSNSGSWVAAYTPSYTGTIEQGNVSFALNASYPYQGKVDCVVSEITSGATYTIRVSGVTKETLSSNGTYTITLDNLYDGNTSSSYTVGLYSPDGNLRSSFTIYHKNKITYSCEAGNQSTDAISSVSVSSATVNYGGSCTWSATVKSGYEFAGWYDAYNYLISANNPYEISSVTSNTKLYARGVLATYTVRIYDCYDGYTYYRDQHDLPKNSEFEVDTYSSPPYGYEYDHAEDENGNVIDVMQMTSNRSLYLFYKKPTYSYSYHYNKNTSDVVTNIPTDQSTTSENKQYSFTIRGTIPIRTGYIFQGWTMDSSGSGVKYSPGDTGPVLTPDNATVTLYAQWEVQTYQMSATYDTGYSAAFTSISVSPKTVNYGGSATFTAVMATGYNFTGWYDASGNLVSSSQTYTARNITSYLSLYARGARNKFTVSVEIFPGYETAFNSVSVSGSEVAYGDTVTFTSSVKTGFSFRGWYDASGNLVSTSVSYSPVIYDNTALYAKANVAWTYSKSRGSRTITAEEWKRLQSFIKGLRSSASFVYSPTAGDTLSKEMYDEVYRVFGKGDRGIIKKKTPVYASYLNDLITEANNL